MGEYIDMSGIDVYGPTSDRMLALLEEKAAALGSGGRVTVHTPLAGFPAAHAP
jgi:hypothetical protein